MSHIIPFPKQNDPSTSQEFPPGKHVLAVYPKTTALYRATVVHAPKVTISQSTYMDAATTIFWFSSYTLSHGKVH